MIWVFNSTPLVYLNKASLSWIFEELEGEKLVPVTVYKQVVVKENEREEADALVTEDLVEKGVLNVVEVENEFKNKLACMEELHEGEIEVLALAKERGGIAILDDSMARETGEIFGIEVHGSLFLIFLMLRRGKIDGKDAKKKVDLMIRKRFRLDSEAYAEFLRLLEGI